MNLIRELRKYTGKSQGEFARYFHIPVQTLQEWEQGRRKPPAYIPFMMKKIIILQKLIEKYMESEGCNMADGKNINERVQKIADKVRKEGFEDGMDFIKKFFEEEERSDPGLGEELSDIDALRRKIMQE